MPRNIRWDESVKENALNLVEALLSQADDELDDLELKAAVYVEWVTQNKLRVTGKEKQKKAKREQIVEVGTRKEHLVKLVKKAGKSLKLPQRKKESGSSQLERELAEVQTALDCLRELGVFEEEKNTRKNQGYWKFTLTLKHQTATREENLEVVKQKWKEHPKTNSLVTSSTTPILETEKSIDWHNICRNRLEKQKQLTTNRLMSAQQMLFDINQICVDLALVERKQPDKRSGNDNPAQSQLYKPDYEETQKLEYEEFLATVLKASPSNKIAIIGEPGAGKTTLLQRIAFWILDKTDNLPIWIPLGNLPTPAPKLKEYLLNNWLEDAILNVTPKIRAEFEELLTAGRVWLLLDGVDEMVANSGNLLSFIDNWIPGWSQQLSVVLTCRLNVWEANPHALNNFQTYRTLEFSQEKVIEFIEACFQESNPALGIQLQQALNQPGKERIKDLIRNPLRLTLLCSTWHLRDGKLPDTKAELYQQFVEEVYRWKKDEFRTEPEEREQLNAKLKELALAAIDKEENRFCLRRKFVEGVLGERDGSVFQLALNIGWLNWVGVDAKNPNPNQPVYAFFHPTFQEYFAALAIYDWDFFLNHVPDNPAQGIYRIFEPQWKEVILLWLGREDVAKEHKEGFINALVTFEDGWEDFYHYRAYFLAGAGIAEFRDNSSIEGVKEAFLTRENAFYKDYVMSIEKLSQYRTLFKGTPGTADLHNSTNANDIVANLAILGFGYYWPYRNGWRKFLIPHGTEEARVALQETDRNRAIALLAWLIPAKQSQVTPNGTYGPNEGTQMDAAQLLGKIGTGNKTAIKALEWLVHNAHDEHIRRIAVENLRKIDSNKAIAHQTLINPISSTQFREGSIRVAEIAEFALHTLFSMIQNFSEEGIRVQAVEKLKEIKLGNKEAAIQALEWLIDNIENEEILYHSAVSLGRVDPGNETASRILVKLMRTHSYDPVVLPFGERLKQNLRGRQYSEAVTELNTELEDYFLKPIVSGGDFRRFLDCYRVIWHCAENMTYPAFYQAWHQQEGVGKTTTSDSQSLNQADLPQSLQSAIANDAQLSQSIHLICIDGSQFIERDRPAAEIYDQMLDHNCPECDPVPKTMPALKLYWNSLKRNSDKRPVLVFYASSTEPYSEAFLTDLSKFRGAICVMTSPPTPLLQGEGSKMQSEGSKSSSGSPSSPWGEGVRGWGSLQFFAPSQAIANMVEWIQTMVVVE